MATCCEISDATYPTDYHEKRILPSYGLSLVPILKGGFRQPHEILYWEHIGSVGIRKENWKLVAARDEAWELFDLSVDRTERQNLIKNFQNIAGKLHLDWMKWAKENTIKISEIHSNLPKIEQN